MIFEKDFRHDPVREEIISIEKHPTQEISDDMWRAKVAPVEEPKMIRIETIITQELQENVVKKLKSKKHAKNSG